MYLINSPLVTLKDFRLNFSTKECITTPFSYQVYPGHKIAIIGRNGSGKSSLLRVILRIQSCEGDIIVSNNANISYIPQLITDNNYNLSGGQRFNQKLSQAIANKPNIMLLDEPTNHLDSKNRQALFGFIKRYQGALLIATHDVELLSLCDTIWHIFNSKINVFNGNYVEYMEQQQHEWSNLTDTVKTLNQQKKIAHEELMQAQQRAKNSRRQGEKHIRQRKWPTVTSPAKARRAETTAGKKTQQIARNKEGVLDRLQSLYIPKAIIPKFNLDAAYLSANKIILSIEDGEITYATSKSPILTKINLQLLGCQKIALTGDNGSGKSTLFKAILNDSAININGRWSCPVKNAIGYVDQHYSNLLPTVTAAELLEQLMPSWSYIEIREHLNMFLLRKNEEVNLPTMHLSGGEKLRLILALIAARPPKLLLLDEITNNIDLETKEHLLQVLNNYPGAVILTCHDNDFIQRLALDTFYYIENGMLIHQIT